MKELLERLLREKNPFLSFSIEWRNGKIDFMKKDHYFLRCPFAIVYEMNIDHTEEEYSDLSSLLIEWLKEEIERETK